MRDAFDAAPATLKRDGATWRKDRPAMKDQDGSVRLSQLRCDEFIVSPGIIYRREAMPDA